MHISLSRRLKLLFLLSLLGIKTFLYPVVYHEIILLIRSVIVSTKCHVSILETYISWKKLNIWFWVIIFIIMVCIAVPTDRLKTNLADLAVGNFWHEEWISIFIKRSNKTEIQIRTRFYTSTVIPGGIPTSLTWNHKILCRKYG